MFIRLMTVEDYSRVYTLWAGTAGVGTPGVGGGAVVGDGAGVVTTGAGPIVGIVPPVVGGSTVPWAPEQPHSRVRSSAQPTRAVLGPGTNETVQTPALVGSRGPRPGPDWSLALASGRLLKLPAGVWCVRAPLTGWAPRRGELMDPGVTRW